MAAPKVIRPDEGADIGKSGMLLPRALALRYVVFEASNGKLISDICGSIKEGAHEYLKI